MRRVAGMRYVLVCVWSVHAFSSLLLPPRAARIPLSRDGLETPAPLPLYLLYIFRHQFISHPHPVPLAVTRPRHDTCAANRRPFSLLRLRCVNVDVGAAAAGSFLFLL